MTAEVLFFYSIGLFAYGCTRILQNGFFALKDTGTPAKVAGIALAVNVVLNSLLMFPLKISGLALATSLSGINTFFILFWMLRKKLGGLGGRKISLSFLRILLSSFCMGAVCYFVSKGIFLKDSLLDKMMNLGFSLISGLLSYIVFCFLFRVSEMKQLWEWLRAKLAS